MSERNWAPKTIWTGDNLPIMRRMNSACVDLVYLDPPFNSNADYAAPIGSRAAGAEFKDTWTLSDVDREWIDMLAPEGGNPPLDARYPALYHAILTAVRDSKRAYLAYMAPRLLEMHRILKPTGTLYLHCDPTMSHYLKVVMDAIFGDDNFRNEIVWCYTGPRSASRNFPKQHDVVLRYSKGEEWVFHADAARIPHRRQTLSGGRGMASGGRSLAQVQTHEAEQIRKGKLVASWWADIGSGSHMPKGERLGFPTQKPMALLERIVRVSSNPGDIVFDPFCGCATTMAAADKHGRDWVGIDISEKAVELVVSRIENQQGIWREIVARSDIPQRTDLGKLPPYNSVKNKDLLYGRQGGDCNGCGTHFEKRILEVDHFIAKSAGGTDHIDNLQLLCPDCNRKKGNRGMEYLTAKLRIVREKTAKARK